jgi:hypothetical protein
MSTHISYKENLPYKSIFLNRKLLHDKTSKKINICSEGPITPFSIQQSLMSNIYLYCVLDYLYPIHFSLYLFINVCKNNADATFAIIFTFFHKSFLTSP